MKREIHFIPLSCFVNIITCPTDVDLCYLSLSSWSLKVSCLGWSPMTSCLAWQRGLPGFVTRANILAMPHTSHPVPPLSGIIKKPSFIRESKLCNVASNHDSRLAKGRWHWNSSQVPKLKRISFAWFPLGSWIIGLSLSPSMVYHCSASKPQDTVDCHAESRDPNCSNLFSRHSLEVRTISALLQFVLYWFINQWHSIY